MQRIFGILLIAAVGIAGVVGYVHWSRTHAMDTGEVHVRQLPSETAKSETPGAASANEPAQPGDQPPPRN